MANGMYTQRAATFLWVPAALACIRESDMDERRPT